MSTTTFAVTGLTCQHCVQAVTSEFEALPGVSSVSVELHAGETSVVTVDATTAITSDQAAAALDEAGAYTLA